jgi:hypothetical protein
MSDLWPWLAVFGLGAYHGVNPGMGWLFAVALGLQEKSRRAIYKSLLPIACGHAASIGVIIMLVWWAQAILPYAALRPLAAVALVAFGVYRLCRFRHPRWVGMRVGPRDLMLWSFLMASAHGAGLMLVPFLLGWLPAAPMPHAHHAGSVSRAFSPEAMAALAGPRLGFMVVGVHTMAYFLVVGLVALVVYEKLGLALLRRAWFNLDWLWAAALVAAGLLTQFL